MKTLQSNFTTPEQSNRLLELGVPADSADCIFTRYSKYEKWKRRFIEDVVGEQLFCNQDFYFPCWSVGRLIEIYLTCALEYHPYDDFYTETPSLHLMAFDKDRLIEEVIEIMSEDEMDFSKLEK